MLKNLVYLSIFTTFVVLVWVALSIYNSINSSTITRVESTQIIPINPTFNTAVITSLQNRIQVPVDLSSQLTSTQSASGIVNGAPVETISLPSLTPTPTLVSSPTAPIASQSAGNSVPLTPDL